MRDAKIQLDGEYRLEADSVCWTLIFDKITGKDPKTGKDKRRYETWYYPSLELSLRSYRDMVLREANSIKDLMKRIDDSDAVIKAALEKATGQDLGTRVFDKCQTKKTKEGKKPSSK